MVGAHHNMSCGIRKKEDHLSSEICPFNSFIEYVCTHCCLCIQYWVLATIADILNLKDTDTNLRLLLLLLPLTLELFCAEVIL